MSLHSIVCVNEFACVYLSRSASSGAVVGHYLVTDLRMFAQHSEEKFRRTSLGSCGCNVHPHEFAAVAMHDVKTDLFHNAFAFT